MSFEKMECVNARAQGCSDIEATVQLACEAQFGSKVYVGLAIALNHLALKKFTDVDAKVVAELKQLIREKIAPFAMPDYVQVSSLNDFMVPG